MANKSSSSSSNSGLFKTSARLRSSSGISRNLAREIRSITAICFVSAIGSRPETGIPCVLSSLTKVVAKALRRRTSIIISCGRMAWPFGSGFPDEHKMLIFFAINRANRSCAAEVSVFPAAVSQAGILSAGFPSMSGHTSTNPGCPARAALICVILFPMVRTPLPAAVCVNTRFIASNITGLDR